jgi:hypothetical protein
MHFDSRSRTATALLTLGGLSVALGLGLWMALSNIAADDRAIVDRILATRGALASFSSIYPGEWDHVCYLDPYSFPSQRIAQYLPRIGPELTFMPGDRWVDEERQGLVFIDSNSKGSLARVFLLENRWIYHIEGPRCVERERAAFRVETVDAPNKTYTRLSILSDSPK